MEIIAVACEHPAINAKKKKNKDKNILRRGIKKERKIQYSTIEQMTIKKNDEKKQILSPPMGCVWKTCTLETINT